jgi:hypothetical protein
MRLTSSFDEAQHFRRKRFGGIESHDAEAEVDLGLFDQVKHEAGVAEGAVAIAVGLDDHVVDQGIGFGGEFHAFFVAGISCYLGEFLGQVV